MPDTMQDTTTPPDESRGTKPDLGAAVSEIKTALSGKAEELAVMRQPALVVLDLALLEAKGAAALPRAVAT